MKREIFVEQSLLLQVLGPQFVRLERLRETLGVEIETHDTTVTIKSRSAVRLKKAETAFNELLQRARLGQATPLEAQALLAPSQNGQNIHGAVTHGNRGNIFIKTAGQAAYVEAVRKNDLTFAIGPAGTGKTFLAVAMAVEALRRRQVDRIVLVRPAVEAGENLGFLPGTLKEKIDPYLAPLYDALFDILPEGTLERYFLDKIVEISPLAYMRGRTLSHAFIILDEAQNATPTQMKMFLTRLGMGAKAIVAGDATQVDLDPRKPSGLASTEKILHGIEGIAFVGLTSDDVVRHPLVRNIVNAYEAFEKKNGSADKGFKP